MVSGSPSRAAKETEVSRRARSDGYEQCNGTAVRFLGMGESAAYPSWLERLDQCKLKSNDEDEEDREEEDEEKSPETVARGRKCCIM